MVCVCGFQGGGGRQQSIQRHRGFLAGNRRSTGLRFLSIGMPYLCVQHTPSIVKDLGNILYTPKTHTQPSTHLRALRGQQPLPQRRRGGGGAASSSVGKEHAADRRRVAGPVKPATFGRCRRQAAAFTHQAAAHWRVVGCWPVCDLGGHHGLAAAGAAGLRCIRPNGR